MARSKRREQRMLQLGQAVMLGVQLERRARAGTVQMRWYFTLPEHIMAGLAGQPGWVSGPFEWRWQAVEAALRVVGVIRKEAA